MPYKQHTSPIILVTVAKQSIFCCFFFLLQEVLYESHYIYVSDLFVKNKLFCQENNQFSRETRWNRSKHLLVLIKYFKYDEIIEAPKMRGLLRLLSRNIFNQYQRKKTKNSNRSVYHHYFNPF